MPESQLQVDVLVIGGGIMGLFATLEAARAPGAPRDVLCLRLADAPVPRAETLRNQGWLQSGLRYAGRSRPLAEHMWVSGLAILQTLGVRVESRRGGVLRLRGRDELRGLLELSEVDLEGCCEENLAGIWDVGEFIGDRLFELGQLDEQEARELLGPAFEEPQQRGGLPYLTTRESTFDEARLLDTLRARARAQGARLRLVDEPVRLERREGRACAFVGSTCVAAEQLVLAAGAGNFVLLQQLGADLDMAIKRTPLPVLNSPPGYCASVFVSHGVPRFSLTRHSVAEGARLVVGVDLDPALAEVFSRTGKWNSRSAPLADDGSHALPARQVPEPIADAATKLLPPWLMNDDSLRFTAGFEIFEPVEEKEVYRRLRRPWIAPLEGFANQVVLVHPARATLAQVAVQQLFDRVPLGKPRGEFASDEALPGRDWTEAIRMHFAYPDLDEKGASHDDP